MLLGKLNLVFNINQKLRYTVKDQCGITGLKCKKNISNKYNYFKK